MSPKVSITAAAASSAAALSLVGTWAIGASPSSAAGAPAAPSTGGGAAAAGPEAPEPSLASAAPETRGLVGRPPSLPIPLVLAARRYLYTSWGRSLVKVARINTRASSMNSSLSSDWLRSMSKSVMACSAASCVIATSSPIDMVFNTVVMAGPSSFTSRVPDLSASESTKIAEHMAGKAVWAMSFCTASGTDAAMASPILFTPRWASITALASARSFLFAAAAWILRAPASASSGVAFLLTQSSICSWV
mmetsp:Transcript_24558/g.55350  ORF Transcript_24558/g.55350 Transcript_24558/m.55350 type:complete len:249 (+) Transcript_24558:261-1007(+)